MNTTSQNQIINSELNNRSHQQSQTGTISKTRQAVEEAVNTFSTPTAGDCTAQDIAEQKTRAAKTDTRLPIDSEARKQNRTLPTPKVLSALHQQAPAAYRLAEVVGRWVWVHFKEQPTAEIRQQLAQLGFHWNRERQAWQHPCGQFSLGSAQDPHEKYSSYHPARVKRSTKTKTQEAVAA